MAFLHLLPMNSYAFDKIYAIDMQRQDGDDYFKFAVHGRSATVLPYDDYAFNEADIASFSVQMDQAGLADLEIEKSALVYVTVTLINTANSDIGDQFLLELLVHASDMSNVSQDTYTLTLIRQTRMNVMEGLGINLNRQQDIVVGYDFVQFGGAFLGMIYENNGFLFLPVTPLGT